MLNFVLKKYANLLADNTIRNGAENFVGHKDVLGFEVPVEGLVFVEILEGLRDVECAEDTLSAIRVAWDDLGDEG